MSTPCHCAVLRKATRRVTALYDDALSPSGINVAQFSLLRNVGRHGPISLTELGRRLDLDRSTIGRNVKLLLGRDLLARTETGDDLRETVVKLSDSGRAVLDDAEPAWNAAQVHVETTLGDDGARMLHQLLGAL